MNREEILEYIRNNIDSKTYKQMAENLGMTTESVRGRARRAGIKKSKRKYNRTKDSYNKELEEKNSDFVLLEDFTRVGDYLLHKCMGCERVEERRPQDILITPNCSYCSAKKTNKAIPLGEMLSLLPSKYLYVRDYEGMSSKCTFLCRECDNIWQVQPTRIIHGGIGCPRCKGINTSKRCRKPIEEVHALCEEYGLEFLDGEYLGNKVEHKFRNKSCGHEFLYKFNYIKENTCKVCSQELKISTPEKEVRDFIQSLGFTTRKGKLSDGKEVDIVVEGTNIGIEFNGDYWHSEVAGKDSKYHLNKTNLFDGKLIHIFHFMWNDKKDLLKSMLKHSLGVTDRKIYARKTVVKKITAKEARPFLDRNHIQGFLAANKYLGLYYKDELVSIMTFNKSRFSKKYEYELGRYAVAIDTSVVGGASKLFKYFVNNFNPKSIVSYCHRFYSDGNLYKSLGMGLAGTTRPGYWYLHPDRVMVSTRQKFQKHKLKDKLPIFDPNKTEAENMLENGYTRIYDCGNYVFEWYL